MAVEPIPALWTKALLAVVLAVGVALFARRLFFILRLVRSGQRGNKLEHLWTRLSFALLYVFGQTRVLRNRVVGIAHIVIFYGFLVISLGTANIVWSGFSDEPLLPAITKSLLFSGLLDVFASLVIVAIIVSAYRRFVIRPPEVHNSVGSTTILALIFFLMVTLLLTEAVEYRLGSSVGAPPVGTLVSTALSGLNASQISFIHFGVWWLHVLLLVRFLVHVPYSKHMHLLLCPVNEFLRPLRPKGQIRSVDVDSPDPIGAGAFNQFGRKQLLDLFVCTECGRCTQNCPAHARGSSLDPREVILDLRKGLLEHAGGSLNPKPRPGAVPSSPSNGVAVADAIGREAVWACTTCRACQEQCPVFIEHVDKIIDSRRYLLDCEGASPALSRALEGLSLVGNPQMLPPSERMSIPGRLKIPLADPSSRPEVVLWLGCSAAYEPKAQDVATALMKILTAARVDFAVVGESERCCGDPARRVGEEGLFQELALQNIANLKRLGVTKILTSCPHCYNTFLNEYRELGAEFGVMHHSDFILELLSAKRIVLSRPVDQSIAFHDPCYLGRYNNIYDSPREVLRLASSAEVLELPRRRDKAFCCGGGGGQMYLEAVTGTKINRLRFAEAQATQASTIATACPSCKIMLDDAAQYDVESQRVRVKDIAELVCESAQL